MKTRVCVMMLIIGCFLAMSVYAARKSSKEKTAVPADKTVSVGEVNKQKVVSPKTEMDKVSYTMGVQLGQDLKEQDIKIKLEPLIWGLRDAMAGNKLALSQDEMQKVMLSFGRRMFAKQRIEAAKNLVAGTEFLEANSKKEGVKVLLSGLQYKIIRKGTGRTPTAADKVKAHYRGTFIDGKEFDNSYTRKQPAEIPVDGILRGWTEALQLMKEGAKWELYIPANLACGERGRENIPPNSTLIFEIELIEVIKKK
ncbi:MAG: FKBP-type peptidyl-prolyl cis-trans isomerase [Planctomycetota bacterium]